MYAPTLNESQKEEILQECFNSIIKDKGIDMMKFISYLKNEHLNGANEFRIYFQGETHIIVHPLNKDGETLDMDI